ncbi:MAG: hypothetical protein ACQETB_05040 [Halobacteriota archaeon]
MGRTNPTFRDRLRSIEADWQPFRRGLRAADQPYFDRCFDHAAAHAAAAGYRNPLDPWPAIVLAIAIEQQRRLEEIDARLDDLETSAFDLETRRDDPGACAFDLDARPDGVDSPNPSPDSSPGEID